MLLCELLCWVFVATQGLSLVAASRNYSVVVCGLLIVGASLADSCFRAWVLRHVSTVAVAHGLSCTKACEIFPDKGSSPCPLPWQADSYPLDHQGSPCCFVLFFKWRNLHVFQKSRKQMIDKMLCFMENGRKHVILGKHQYSWIFSYPCQRPTQLSPP